MLNEHLIYTKFTAYCSILSYFGRVNSLISEAFYTIYFSESIPANDLFCCDGRDVQMNKDIWCSDS